jgi:hypothetical protein
LGPEISASRVAALGNRTTIPCARRLAHENLKWLISRPNATTDNFETASSSYNEVITVGIAAVMVLVSANWVWTQMFTHLTEKLA